MRGAVPGAVADDLSDSDNTEMTGPHIERKHLLGRINPAVDASFSRVRSPYANREGLYLLEEVYGAFIAMHKAAKEDGISLVIISATRTFDAQKEIWQRKWTGARLVDDTRTILGTDPIKTIDFSGEIKVRAFVTGSIIECFVDDAEAFSIRAYDLPSGARSIEPVGADVEIREWKVKTLSPGFKSVIIRDEIGLSR